MISTEPVEEAHAGDCKYSRFDVRMQPVACVHIWGGGRASGEKTEQREGKVDPGPMVELSQFSESVR